MPRYIHKFPLEIVDTQFVFMPGVSRILSVQVQHGRPCLWAEVDPSKPKIRRMIFIVGTGHELPKGYKTFVGTVQQLDGRLVWHIYDGGEFLVNSPE